MVTVVQGLYDFQEDEILAARARFPKLVLQSMGMWKGEIDIDAVNNGIHIRDTFSILIAVPDKYPSELPAMVEMGGRTDSIVEKYRLEDKRDLHYNTVTRIACLCVKQDEKIRFPVGSNLVTFLDNLVVPYLYGLGYFDRNGKWPWGEYGHGGVGLLEYYETNGVQHTANEVVKITKIIRNESNWKDYNQQFRKPSKERSCLCGSKKPFKKCHPLAWSGMINLLSEIRRLGLDVDKLFTRDGSVKKQ